MLASSCVRQFSSTVTTTCRGPCAPTRRRPAMSPPTTCATTTSGQTDLARLKLGGVGAQFWSVYIPGETGSGFARTQLEQIDIARRIIARYPDRLQFRDDGCRHSRRASRRAHRLAAGHGRRARHREFARRAARLLRSRRALHDADAQRAHELGGLAGAAAGARRPHAVRRAGRAGDEPARHAGRSVAHLRRHDGRRAARVAGAGDLLAFLGARALRRAAQRAGRHPEASQGERRRGDGHVRRRLHRSRGRRRAGAGDGGDQPPRDRQERRGAREDRGGSARQAAAAEDPDRARSPITSSTSARSRASSTSASAATTTATDVAGRAVGRLDVSEPVRRADPPRLERRGPEAAGRRKRAACAGAGRGGLAPQEMAAERDDRTLAILDRPRRHVHRHRRPPARRRARHAQAAVGEPGAVRDAAVQGIRELLGVAPTQPIPAGDDRGREDGHDGRDQRAARAQGRAHGARHHARLRRRAAHRLPEPAQALRAAHRAARCCTSA